MSNEWYTPARYVEAARQVMGNIDLDPASSELANGTVKATTFYTKQENGLFLPWFGNVWCNPPYTQITKGHSSIKAWVHRAVSFYEQRAINQAILLIPNDTSTRWFELLWKYPICFPGRRIKFDIPGQKHEQPTFGTCFAYLGSNYQKFTEVFRKYGRVARAIDAIADPPTNLELWYGGVA